MCELKPCPFCGGKAAVRFSGHRYTNGYVKGYIVVGCNTCMASVRGAYYQGDSLDILPYSIEETVGAEKAIEKWNRRVE